MDLDVDVVTHGQLRRRRRPAPTDDANLTATRQDQAERVGALYAEHALGLIRLAHIMLGSPAAAEDVVQEAFCGLYRRWLYLEDPSRAVGYLRSSVLNGCRSAHRRVRDAELDETHELAASSAETAVLAAEVRQEIMRAVRGLPSRQREVLTLRFYLDLPDDQIAELLGIARVSVRSAAHRGLIALRRTLKDAP